MAKSITPDEFFMREAMYQAGIASSKGEVPVGAVIEYKGKVFSKAYNKRIANKSSVAHAEILAIQKACKKLGDWRLEDMTIYVTAEPCLMCAGAIIHSRIARLVYGCSEPKMGAHRSQYRVFNNKTSHHKIAVTSGVLKDECKNILRVFFKDLRNSKKKGN